MCGLWDSMGGIMVQQNDKKKISIFCCTVLLILISILAVINGELYLYLRINELEKQQVADRIECALQHEDDPMKTDFRAFCRLYDDLQDFVYLEIYDQPLDVVQKGRKHFDSYTKELSENPDRVACLQISKNVVEKYQLKIDTGRMWLDTEFIMEDYHIPVILGSEYAGIYKIGDVFEAEYLYELYDFSVIGFFGKNSVIHTGRTGFINVDQFIVMPSFRVHEDALSTDGLKIHYANKTSGIIELERDSYLKDYRELEDKINSSGCGKYSLNLYPLYAHFQNRYGVSIYVMFGLLTALGIGCGAMILYLFHKFRNQYSLSLKKYICLCFVPILLYFLVERSLGNNQHYFLHIICIFLTEGILIISHLLIEIFFQKLKRRDKA